MNRRLLALPLVLAMAVPATAGAAPARPYDLNGDGRAELVIGMPEWRMSGGERVAALIYNGRKRGMLGKREFVRPAQLGLDPERFDDAGAAVASGDFDADGYADLAIGAPSYNIGDAQSPDFPGAVGVLYGAPRFPASHRGFFQGPVADEPFSFARFGASLVAGDLNGDGYADLVVGAPGDDREGSDEDVQGSGALHVLFGGPSGLTGDGQSTIGRANRDDPAFGDILALGDMNDDRRSDVFEAYPGSPRWIDDPPTPGHLTVALNGEGGPGPAQWIRGVYRGGPTSLAVGDVTGDGFDDLVAGVPVNTYVGEDERFPAGLVHVWRGGANGPSRKPLTISQKTRGVPGSNESFDSFGSSIAVGRIDGDRFADIVVSAPGEDRFRGRVTVLRGGPRGVARRGHTVLDRAAGKRVRGTAFGSELTLLNLGGDRRRDLAVLQGASQQDVGVIKVLRGVKGGFRQRRPVTRDLKRLGLKPDDLAAVFGRDASSD